MHRYTVYPVYSLTPVYEYLFLQGERLEIWFTIYVSVVDRWTTMTSNIFAVDKNVTHNLLEEFGRTEKTANEDVFAIKKWLTTQHHLPEIMGKSLVL